jgi:hypothetical protein
VSGLRWVFSMAGTIITGELADSIILGSLSALS